MGDAAPMIGISEIDAYGCVAQTHLARFRIGHRPIFPLHDFWRSELVDHLGF
jgi:hypothetical protein